MMENKPFSFGIKLKKIEAKFSAKGTYLECTTDGHNKFYYLYIKDNTDIEHRVHFSYIVETHFGKINTTGNRITSKFKFYGDAEKFIVKRVKQKTEKGYIRVKEPTSDTKF